MSSKTTINYDEYSDLSEDGGFNVKTPVDPEDEFFHAIYISGQQRKNHLGEVEMPGKLQIRGLRSNLDEINIVITSIKNVLVRTTRSKEGRENLDCFSYQTGVGPWKGLTGRTCGKNSIERAADQYCNSCRSQLIVAGIYLDEKTGKPFLNDKKQSAYVFIRAKGTKYGNVADYLGSLTKREDLEPIVTPVTEQSKDFERRQVNHKRFVTKITVGKQSSNYGLKDVFELSCGQQLSIEAVKNILNKSKETSEKFKEKFDWSRGKNPQSNYSNTSAVSEDQKFTDLGTDSKDKKVSETVQEAPKENKSFDFGDIDF